MGGAFALTLRALFRYSGPPMEEGFMLVFPEQLLHGRVPHRDFLHLYGPGSLWALAGWYKVLGVSLTAERIFGLGQLAVIVGGVMALVRPWGRWAMLAAGLMGVMLTTTAIGLTALAWNGAAAFAVAGLWCGLRGRRWIDDVPDTGPDLAERSAGRFLIASGALAGAALLMRPDAVLAIGLGTAALLFGLGWSRWRRWLTGAVPVLSLYVVHFAVSGPGNAFRGMFTQPVFDLRDGRSLPRPPSPDHYAGALQAVAQLREPPWWGPAFASPMQIFLWFFLLPAVVAFILAVGVWSLRRQPGSWRSRVVLVVGLFSLGLMPQALQRPDTTHFAWVSCVPLAFLPAAIAHLAGLLTPRATRARAGLVAAVLTLLIPLLVIPHFTARTYTDLVRQGLPDHQVFGYPVDNDGRRFYLGAPDIAEAAQRMLDEMGPQMRSGQRLLVGPVDMRKTPYSDAYLYYLLPKLVPGTRYIEMDPAVANAPGSGLAHEVATSDWLILSHVWDVWDEPNASRDFGSAAPNREVARHFCQVKTYGTAPTPFEPKGKVYFQVYRRCR